MSSEHSIDEQKAANLARIRDNQRRSRARRKEYLQELEERYRVCEQVGVEASAEMQAAARRVIEENRVLRTMLRQHGYTDTDLDQVANDGSHPLPPVPALEAEFGRRSSVHTQQQQQQRIPLESNLPLSLATHPPAHAAPRQTHYASVNQAQYQTAAAFVGPSSMPLAYPSTWMHRPRIMLQQQHTAQPAISIGRGGQYYDAPSLQSIKSEIGYGPQEELDCQSTDAEYAINDDQQHQQHQQQQQQQVMDLANTRFPPR